MQEPGEMKHLKHPPNLNRPEATWKILNQLDPTNQPLELNIQSGQIKLWENSADDQEAGWIWGLVDWATDIIDFEIKIVLCIIYEWK